MEDVLVLFGIVLVGLVLFWIVAGILAISAFRRSGAHARQIEDLQRELTSTTERLRTLERTAAPYFPGAALRMADQKPPLSVTNAVVLVPPS